MIKSNRILSLTAGAAFGAAIAAINPALAADPLEEALLQDPPDKSQTASTPAPVTCVLTGAAELGPVCAQNPSTLQTPSLPPAELGPVPAPVHGAAFTQAAALVTPPSEQSEGHSSFELLMGTLGALGVGGTAALAIFYLGTSGSRRRESETKKDRAEPSYPRTPESYGVAPHRPGAVPPSRSRPSSSSTPRPYTGGDAFLNPANPASPLSPLDVASPLSSGWSSQSSGYSSGGGGNFGGGGASGGYDSGSCGGSDGGGGGGGCDISSVQRIRSMAGITSVLEP